MNYLRVAWAACACACTIMRFGFGDGGEGTVLYCVVKINRTEDMISRI